MRVILPVRMNTPERMQLEKLGMQEDTYEDTIIRDAIFYHVDAIHLEFDDDGNEIGCVLYSGGGMFSCPLSMKEADQRIVEASHPIFIDLNAIPKDNRPM